MRINVEDLPDAHGDGIWLEGRVDGDPQIRLRATDDPEAPVTLFWDGLANVETLRGFFEDTVKAASPDPRHVYRTVVYVPGKRTPVVISGMATDELSDVRTAEFVRFEDHHVLDAPDVGIGPNVDYVVWGKVNAGSPAEDKSGVRGNPNAVGVFIRPKYIKDILDNIATFFTDTQPWASTYGSGRSSLLSNSRELLALMTVKLQEARLKRSKGH